MKRVVALALLTVACRSEAIRKERFVRKVETARIGMRDDGPRGLAGRALSRVDGECEPGDVLDCHASTPPASDGRGAGQKLYAHCVDDGRGRWEYHWEDCATPLVIVWDDAKVAFTEPAGSPTEWVSTDSPWLVRDCHLFEGFAPLAAFDDDGDGRIDVRDAVFHDLALWADEDQDRVCTEDELEPLAARGISAIDLGYVTPPRVGPPGSREGETASVSTTRGRARVVDVYLAPRR